MENSCSTRCSCRCAMPIIVALIAGGAFIYGKQVEVRHIDRVTINVTGEGKVNTVPDIARLSFGVESGRQSQPDEAMAMVSEKMNTLFKILKDDFAVEEKDITTQSLSLNPSYDWEDGKRTDQGFEAQQNLSVKIRDTEKAGAIIAAMASHGANQIGGISFTIDDPKELQAMAREKAIDDAKAKAEVLADQLGMSLGKIVSFNEGGGYVPMARMYAEDAMVQTMGVGGGGAEPLALPAGEQEISTTVTLSVELK